MNQKRFALKLAALLHDAYIGLCTAFGGMVKLIVGFLDQSDGLGGAGGHTQPTADTAIQMNG